MVKLVIFGYYGYSNRGDEAILEGILKLISDIPQNIEVLILSKNSTYKSNEFKCESQYMGIGITDFLFKPISRILAYYKIICSDLLIIGGGGLFHDYWGIIPFSTLPVVMRAAIHKPTLIFCVGVGPYKRNISKYLLNRYMKLTSKIIVRDSSSLILLEEMGIRNALPSSDPALNLSINYNLNITDIESLKGLKFKKFFVVSLRSWPELNCNNNLSNLTKLLDFMLEMTQLDLLFIPFDDNDPNVIEIVQSKLKYKDKTSILLGEYQNEEIITIISEAVFLIGMRLHSLIFSLCAGIPFFGVSYDPKVKSFTEEVYGRDNDYFIKLTETNTEIGFQKAERFLSNLENSRHIVKEKHYILKERLCVAVSSLKSLIANK